MEKQHPKLKYRMAFELIAVRYRHEEPDAGSVTITPPRLATPAYLDAIGAAAAALERALGGHGSPFAEALTFGMASAEEFAAEVEGTYRLELV